jgi:hypothetical protein
MGVHEVVVLHFILRTCQIGAVYERVVDCTGNSLLIYLGLSFARLPWDLYRTVPGFIYHIGRFLSFRSTSGYGGFCGCRCGLS